MRRIYLLCTSKIIHSHSVLPQIFPNIYAQHKQKVPFGTLRIAGSVMRLLLLVQPVVAGGNKAVFGSGISLHHGSHIPDKRLQPRGTQGMRWSTART